MTTRSQIVVHLVLIGVWVGSHWRHLVRLFVFEPRVNQVLGEDIALGEELVILTQRVEGGFKRAGQLRDVLLLSGRQLVEVLVDWCGRLDSALDAVDTRHEARGESKIWVRARVRYAVLHALGLWGCAGHGNADAC